jgi:hypothetical protein
MDRFLACMLLLVALLSGCASSPEDAVIIRGVSKQSEGLVAEYNYISGIHGIKNKNWSLYGQTIMKENGKVYDVIEIKLIDFNNEQRIYYFDVTSFPWKKQ